MSRLFPILLLFLIVAVWGWTFVVVKDAIETYGVLSFLMIRFSIATVSLGPVAWPHLTKDSLLIGLWIGVVLGAAYLFQTFGLKESTPTNTGLITGLGIVFTPLTNYLFFRVRIARRMGIAVVLSLIGLVLLTGSGTEGLMRGDVITLGAAFCLGLHVTLLDRFARNRRAAVLAFGQMLSATAIMVLLWVMLEGSLTAPSPQVWFALGLTGVVATAIGFSVQTFVQQRLSAVQTSVIIITEPLFAAFFGYLLAGDRLTFLQWMGAALMMGAVVVAELSPLLSRRPKPARDYVIEPDLSPGE